MKTITIKLLTANEAVTTLQHVWGNADTKIGDEPGETLVFLIDKTSQAEMKKQVGGAIYREILSMTPKAVEKEKAA